ncbi:hypothetical protein ACWOEF_07175 [Enterococcus crotali]
MNDQANRIEALELENENLRLKLVATKEENKGAWASWIWVLVPVVGMIVGAFHTIV